MTVMALNAILSQFACCLPVDNQRPPMCLRSLLTLRLLFFHTAH